MNPLRILPLLALLAGAAHAWSPQDLWARRPTVKVAFQVDRVATNPDYLVLESVKAELEAEIAEMLVESTFVSLPGEPDGSDADYVLTVELGERSSEKSQLDPAYLTLSLAANRASDPVWSLTPEPRFGWMFRDDENVARDFTRDQLHKEVLERFEDMLGSRDLLIRGLLCYATLQTSPGAECEISYVPEGRAPGYRLTLPFAQSDLALDGKSEFAVVLTDAEGDYYHHVISLSDKNGRLVTRAAPTVDVSTVQSNDRSRTLFSDHVLDRVQQFQGFEIYAQEGPPRKVPLRATIVLKPIPGDVKALTPPSKVQP